MNLYGVVLAAGKGTRMKSAVSKVLHPVAGKPMLEYVLDSLAGLTADEVITVVGHGADEVMDCIGEKTAYVRQEEQLGTAHAVLQAAPQLEGKPGITLVLYGDTPLLRPETLYQALRRHVEQKAAVTVLTATLSAPLGYGRILRDETGRFTGVVEEKDASEEQRRIREVNTGIYFFDNEKLFRALPLVKNENRQREYYLPDAVGVLREQGESIVTHELADATEIFGVNDRVALAEVERIMQDRIRRQHMLNGVTLLDPQTTYIESQVVIGQDTVLHPGTVLRGRTVVGGACELGPQADLTDAQVGDRVFIRYSVLTQSHVESDVSVGPYAHLRPGTVVSQKAKIGDFVELKNTVIGVGSKVPHLSYMGDADVGAAVNIGCGVVTVNYDGFQKFRTKVGDRAFIGCNTNLIAPVEVGSGAYVAAGSTINKNVPEEALAIARARQENKEGYVSKLRKGRGQAPGN